MNRIISFFEKPFLYLIIFCIVLLSFTVYVLLDAFYIERTYAVLDDTIGNFTTLSDESADEIDTTSKVQEKQGIYVEPGVRLKTYSDENIEITIEQYEGEGGSFYVADIKLSSVDYLRTALHAGRLGKNITAQTSVIAENNNALFAINGDYASYNELGVIMRNGKVLRVAPREDEQYGLIVDICAVVMIVICLIVKPFIFIDSWLVLLVTAFICGTAALTVSVFVAFNKNERGEILKPIDRFMSYLSARSLSVRYTFEIFSYSTYSTGVKYFLFPFVLLVVIARRIMHCNDMYKMDFVITTRCSLKCKHCSNLMQHYGNDTVTAKDFSIESINSDLDKLSGLCDRVWQIIIVGGEAFMNKDLPEILLKLISMRKIKQIKIITNGTIIPNESLIAIMKNNKIQVTISDYGKASKNKDKLLEVLHKNNVKCKMLELMEWVDRGEIKKRNRTVEELKNVFSTCISKCTTLMNGKIYDCEVYSNGVNLGYIDELADEVIDIRSITKKEFSKQLKAFNKRKYIHACDYCGEVNYSESNTVKAGIQL